MTELTQIVEQALRDCRNGDWLLLAISPLATTHLVEECWFTDEKAANQVTPDMRGRALQAIFCWVIDKLRPAGEPDWAMRAWRPYLVLAHYYLHGAPLAQLAEQLGISERSVHNLRQKAINSVVQLLQSELKENNAPQQRRYYVINQRIARRSAHQQQLLRYAALFRQPFPPHWLDNVQLNRTAAQENPMQHDTHELLAAHLLCRAGQDHVLLHPEVGELIRWQPFRPEQLQWHWQAAHWYEQSHDYLEAAWHQRQARQVQQAAETLLAHQTAIIEQGQAPALYTALQQFQANEVQATTWIKLKLLCGELAESLHDLERASEHYRQALAADDLHLKARAFWQRGRVLAAKQGDEALMHYQRCLELLTGLPD